MTDLAGQTVLITTAAQGIGLASAHAFAKAGANVVATDINAEKQLEGVPRVAAWKLDVLDSDAVGHLVGQIGRMDVLFNCAGVVHSGSIPEMSDDDLEFALELNVRAHRTIKAVLSQMIEPGDGAIINMATVASSIKGVPNRAAYSISKAAVIGLTKSVATDYVASGIRATPSHWVPWTARLFTSGGKRRAILKTPGKPSSRVSRSVGSASRRKSPILLSTS